MKNNLGGKEETWSIVQLVNWVPCSSPTSFVPEVNTQLEYSSSPQQPTSTSPENV